MLKIKISDKPNYLDKKIVGGHVSGLEAICLLDTAIDILENEFELNDEQIWELLKDYRNNLKEVKE